MNDSLKIKIGQMIMAGVPGERVGESFVGLCEKYCIGNFCLSAENSTSLEAVCDLNYDLRKITYANTGIYPFISIDQEGGWVNRYYEGAACVQGNMSHAAAGFDGEGIEKVWARVGQILRAVGCNMNNAPVLDVNSRESCLVVGTRSFGDDPKKVAELGRGALRGLARAQIVGVVKHFPGHGAAEGDTHLVTSVNRYDIDRFRANDLYPFERAFESGASALMTAHVTYEAFGDEPATASRRIMTSLLRGELGFEGVAITDSMNMNAMNDSYPGGEAAVRAIEAGCDILLYYPMNENIFLPAIEAIYAAVESGRISEGRIDESYRRILAVKERFSVAAADPDPTLAKALVFDDETIERTFEEKLSSITCLKGRELLCGLDEKRILCISPVCDALRGVEESRRRILSFADEFEREFENAVACVSSLDGMTDDLRGAIDGKYDIAVVGVFDAASFPAQIEIIDRLKKKGKAVVAVLLRSPYDYKFVSDCDAVITSYEYTPQAVSSTVKAMKNNDYRGVLPIRLGGL